MRGNIGAGNRRCRELVFQEASLPFRPLQNLLPFWARSQPLIPLSIVFAAGIVAARLLQPAPIVLLAGIGLGLVVLLRFKAAGMALLAGSVGASIYWVRYEPFSEHDLRVLLTGEPAMVSVRGILGETPQVREFDEANVSSARMHVLQIRLAGEWQEAEGQIMTRTRGALDIESLYRGQHVEVQGVIQPPRGPRAPGLFDPRAYLKNQLIFFQFHAESPADWKILENTPMPVLEKLQRWAKDKIGRGLPEDDQTRMLWAMTLGWKTALSGEMALPFMRTGTMHIVAVSGLHVACIAVVLTLAMRLFWFSPPCYWWIAPLLWAYTATTGWQISGIRSALMATTLLWGLARLRPASLLNSTAAAALVTLAIWPEQMFQTGFQLSFAVVASIGIMIPWLEKHVRLEWKDDAFLPRRLWPAWKKQYNELSRYLRPSLHVTISSFVGSLPLTAFYFNMCTPVSLLANLIVVPFSSLALTLSMISILSPFGTEFWNWTAWAAMRLTILSALWFDRLGWYYYVPSPGPWFFVSFVGALIVLLAGAAWRLRTRVFAWSLVGIAGAVSLAHFRTGPQMHILPAEGAPVFVDLPGQSNDLLIDCSNDFDFAHTVQPFLRARGVNRLANLVLSHGDIKHIGAFQSLADDFEPRHVHTGPYASRSPADKAARARLDQSSEGWRVVSRGDEINAWEVLHPLPDRKFSRADDNAIVLRTSIEGWRILQVSDLGREGLRSLARSGSSLEADVLIVGASAGDGRLSEDLVHRVSPRVIIFDSGRFNSAEVPKASAPVLSPQESGAISFEFSRRECRVRCADGHEMLLLN